MVASPRRRNHHTISLSARAGGTRHAMTHHEDLVSSPLRRNCRMRCEALEQGRERERFLEMEKVAALAGLIRPLLPSG